MEAQRVTDEVIDTLRDEYRKGKLREITDKVSKIIENEGCEQYIVMLADIGNDNDNKAVTATQVNGNPQIFSKMIANTIKKMFNFLDRISIAFKSL